MTETAIPERFAELVSALLDGNPAPLRRVIEASGAEWSDTVDGITVRRATFACGLSTSDPTSAAVSVAFAIVGPRWAELAEFRAGVALVSARWSAERKAAPR